MQSCETSAAVEIRDGNVDTKASSCGVGALIQAVKVIKQGSETRCVSPAPL